ncbi:hypothetical protein ITP53_11460 [Nonomuraea sp. K274]|uniref:Uncharacterized protein n=1 Tax=Nonomuraea cypriaca TaxID=1187855 RepID=A0A931A4W8_9ACTN|nr:hypothetical protein [Nonomuraea cypriaca]MBF8186356.1 hypothetical protein [Nonomuraea cypriaca]
MTKKVADREFVPRWGTQRRIEALIAIGWHVEEIERRLSSKEMVRRMRQRERVESATARKVAALYEQLWNVAPPESTAALRARKRAERKGWPRPMEWDDDWLDLSPDELERAIAAEVALMDRDELLACNRARLTYGDRSPLALAASREFMRRKSAARREQERRHLARRRAEREQLAQAA